MVRDLDATLLESVRVRRRRLRDAFLRGTLRTRRVTSDNVRHLLIGIVLAGVGCAACAGISFVTAHVGHSNSLRPPAVIVRLPAGTARALNESAHA